MHIPTLLNSSGCQDLDLSSTFSELTLAMREVSRILSWGWHPGLQPRHLRVRVDTCCINVDLEELVAIKTDIASQIPATEWASVAALSSLLCWDLRGRQQGGVRIDWASESVSLG